MLGALLVAAISMQVDVTSTLPEATGLVMYATGAVLILVLQGFGIILSSLVSRYPSVLGSTVHRWAPHVFWGCLLGVWLLANMLLFCDAKCARLKNCKRLIRSE